MNTTSSDYQGILTQKILDRSARIGVVGMGYVGLPFAIEKCRVGFSVVGIDQSLSRVESLNAGNSYIADVPAKWVREFIDKNLLHATHLFDSIPDLDVIVICVPTPLTRNLTPDLQFIEKVTRTIASQLRPGQLVSLESTTYPGTTEELMLPILESHGLKVESDFFLAHSPERVDPGNQRYTTKNTMKVVGGVGPVSHSVAMSFYSQTIETCIAVSSAKSAELVKVFENTFRAVNIALVNELAMLCDRMGISVWEVLDAAFTKPFGIMPFYPGPGVGGHCIPLDPHYLEWKAKEFNFDTHFIALAGEINRRMPRFVVGKATRILNRLGLANSRAKVLLLGVSYKKDLGDWRESPALEILEMLSHEGASVSFYDPFVRELEQRGHRNVGLAELTPAALQAADLVIIVTDHSQIDYGWVAQHSRQILDTRNATRSVTLNRERIVLL